LVKYFNKINSWNPNHLQRLDWKLQGFSLDFVYYFFCYNTLIYGRNCRK